MKAKTSITLSKDLIKLIDNYVEGEGNRSSFIELAVRTYMEILQRNKRDQKDLEVINTISNRLNKEADDVLSYQMELHG
jgi:metal-responsive CopG/Arc/MetJ family transcriptional regulator